MGIFDDFVREEAPRLEPGDYRVEITDVEERPARAATRWWSSRCARTGQKSG